MSREKWWDAIPAQSFIADGGLEGQITITNAIDFKVKQRVIVSANTQPDIQVCVKRVLSENLIVVGPPQSNIDTFTNLTAYTVARSATVHADAQTRPAIPEKELIRAAFAEEPANAFRTLNVDQLGNPISATNPLPITGDVDVTVNSVQLFTKPFDTITATYPSSIQEVYKSRVGGVSGVVQETVTVDYTDATKNLIQDVVRT